MQPKEIQVEDTTYKVTAVKTNDAPLAYRISAQHPTEKDVTYEHSLTIGSVELTKIPTLQELQATLDSVRTQVAEMCHKKFTMKKLHEQLV